MLAPNNNRGMTHQTDEKRLTIFPEYFVGVVKLGNTILVKLKLWELDSI